MGKILLPPHEWPPSKKTLISRSIIYGFFLLFSYCAKLVPFCDPKTEVVAERKRESGVWFVFLMPDPVNHLTPRCEISVFLCCILSNTPHLPLG